MILVTGPTGFIGRNLTENLLKNGYDVRVLARDPELAKELFPKAEVFKGNITDKNSIKGAMSGVTKVVHLAGLIDYKNRKRLLEINYQGTKNVLDCCKNVDKIIFSSSVAVFGPVKGRANEDYICKPSEPYGESKLMAERLVADSEIDHAILRIAPVYGVASPWFNNIMKMISWGIPCPRTDNTVQLVHISDLVQAIKLSLKAGKGTFTIADEKPVKMAHVTRKLVKLLGKRYWTVPPWMVRLPAKMIGMGSLVDTLMENRNYDTTKARQVLKFRPKADMDFELKSMAEYYLLNK